MNTSFVCFSVTITCGLRVCICLSVLISLSHGTLTLLFSTTAYGALDVICRDIKSQLNFRIEQIKAKQNRIPQMLHKNKTQPKSKVDRLDSEEQDGQWFVLLGHIHKLQKGPYPICVSRSGNVRHLCGGG